MMAWLTTMIDRIVHRYLRLPYRLHVRRLDSIGKPRRTLVFIHGIGGNGDVWKEVIRGLELSNTRIVVIDLIGFGQSPRPLWAKYSTTFQARSLHATLVRRGILGPVTVIGHSMGSLVAIEYARRYRLGTERLILCSPPLYEKQRSGVNVDTALIKLFDQIPRSPDQFIALSKLAKKYRVVNRTFSVTEKSFNDFVNALESAVIHQTALDDAKKLSLPIDIIYGISDPVVPPLNLFALARANKHVKVKAILAGHEVMGNYVRPLVTFLNRTLRKTEP